MLNDTGIAYDPDHHHEPRVRVASASRWGQGALRTELGRSMFDF